MKSAIQGEKYAIDATKMTDGAIDDLIDNVLDKAPDKVDWYIYYRVRAEQAPLLHARVSAMQRRLLQQAGVRAMLKQGPQLRDGFHTWMEVYVAAPSDFGAILAREVLNAELSEIIDGERHVEHFWDVTSCA
jgi:hypothetical protein